MDYSDLDFAKLKYTDAYLLLIQRDQSHLDSRTDLTSTWLHPKIFSHWIRNSVNLIPKYSELLVSHRGNLKSEGYLYPYPSRATLDNRVLRSWSHSVTIYSYISHSCHTNISILFGYEDNQRIWHTITYTWYHYHLSNSDRLVTNQFKDYAINPSLSIKIVQKTSSQYKSSLEDVILW